MLRSFISSLLFFLLQIAAISQSPSDSMHGRASLVIADGARLQLISGQFVFTEGPAADKNGNVFFTDQPNNRIWKYSASGKLSVFVENAGRSNGMYFDKKGGLITCADEYNQLWRISPNGKIKILLKDLKGLHFNGPNDLWIDRKGGIYFTDPYYQRTYWTRTSPEIAGQKIYYLAKRKAPVVVAEDLVKPNGIIGTDGYLYIADIGADKTYRYRMADDGSLYEKTLFTAKGSDGMTVDAMGNVYLTGNGVSVFDKMGKLIEHIDVPGDWTANVTFWGKERDRLFITASKAVYSLQMKVKGIE